VTARNAVVVCAMSMLLGACFAGEPPPGRRAVDQPTSLLYPESRFAGVDDFADMKVEYPGDAFTVPGFRPGVVKTWKGAAPHMREVIGIHEDANDAAKYFTSHDPRKSALELATPDNLVSESLPYAAPGDPDSSQIYCYPLHAPDLDQCEAWTWWARYGQYTVQLDAGIGPSKRTIDRGQFEELVELVATHLGTALGPRAQSG
jgi:hypothetical protein